MKPFYRTKGKYEDGRNRIVIVRLKGKSKYDMETKALPKPEILWKILDLIKMGKFNKEKMDLQ